MFTSKHCFAISFGSGSVTAKVVDDEDAWGTAFSRAAQAYQDTDGGAKSQPTGQEDSTYPRLAPMSSARNYCWKNSGHVVPGPQQPKRGEGGCHGPKPRLHTEEKACA